MPVSYKQDEIAKWKAEYGENLTKEMICHGRATHTYAVKTLDGSPLPKDNQILICYADGWWCANFGGNVRRNAPDSAVVDVYVD